MKILSLTVFFLFLVLGVRASEFTVSEPPKNMGEPVNSSFNDFAPALSPEGTSMIFNSNRGGRYQNLYITHLKEGKWSEPEPLAGVNSAYNDESPFLSRDGNTLIFSSDRDGSIEMPKNEKNQIRVSFDLYWSKKAGGVWTPPVPVPGRVNTIHHEKSPALSADGKTLYYNMWTFGDIKRAALVRADFRDGIFTDPEPLPAPFNQGYRDLGLIPAEDLEGFFFSSNRPENIGTFDLYYVSFKKGKFGTPVNLGSRINSMEADIYLSRADQRYYITSSREGGRFDIYSAFVFSAAKSFDTRAIYFDFDKASIKPDSFGYLQALAAYLTENPKIRLEIIGHTDLHGSPDYNIELSRRRAQSVKDHLAKAGLDPRRFMVSGAGSGRPVKKGTGAGIDELNRRTEFKNID